MSVLYIQSSITLITDIQDFLVNNDAKFKEVWNTELKLYRPLVSLPSKSLFTIFESSNPNRVYIVTDSGVTLAGTEMRPIIETRLKKTWMTRQTFRGRGYVYECEDNGLLRICNVTVQGGYKGLLIDADTNFPSTKRLLKELADKFGLGNVPEPVDGESERARLYEIVYK
ncbi:hypothetical protein DASB73_002200 [Starmerella bacillaris]|uniref:Mediator of RNA polymerase II transcription subunit 20 n=1 Tax=Starmerella bacillaris TaxID=1247836 RepID=A0AAV5RDI2_STABA|nr:hypothetical protein DASB73_002200 [Starmerella bacillaris]